MEVTKTLFLVITFLVSTTYASTKFEKVDDTVRSLYLERTVVWHPVDTAHLNLLEGPTSDLAVSPDGEITCRYVEWDKPPTGASPKFNCKIIRTGEQVRVKYGLENREVSAEPVASRLLWALGFYSDAVYPTRVRCIGCPEVNPFKPEPGERRIERTFDYAFIERQYPGAIIEVSEDQGCAWKELEKISADNGGATTEQLGALVLLMVFIQHGDQKPGQQRLACEPEDLRDINRNGRAECDRPVLMVQDLGSTFGRADQFTSPEAKWRYELWSTKEVWNRAAEAEHLKRTGHSICIGDLTGSSAAGQDGIDNPVITEESRKFLADLLMQLTEAQIKDLFHLAHVDLVNEKVRLSTGVERNVTVDDWVEAFKNKRNQIVERDCSK